MLEKIIKFLFSPAPDIVVEFLVFFAFLVVIAELMHFLLFWFANCDFDKKIER